MIEGNKTNNQDRHTTGKKQKKKKRKHDHQKREDPGNRKNLFIYLYLKKKKKNKKSKKKFVNTKKGCNFVSVIKQQTSITTKSKRYGKEYYQNQAQPC